MSVPQSAIDSRVALWLGNIPEWAIDPTVEHMHREDEIALRVAQLDLSHQNHRTVVSVLNLPIGTRNVPMPAGFANPVMVRCNYSSGSNQNRWIPVDIINLDTMPEREMSKYPAIAFWGANNAALLSWAPQIATQLQVYYQPLNLTSKLATSSMPIADLFLALVSACIARRCLPVSKMPVELKKEYKITLDQAIGPWEEVWSKLMNRAPNQGSPRRQSFFNGSFGPGSGGIGGWSSGGY